jgi:hypothetical protein
MLFSIRSVAILSFVGLIAAVAVVAIAIDRGEPVVEEQEVIKQVPVHQTVQRLVEVETEDGKRVKAFVPDDKLVYTAVTALEQTTREPTPEQRLRLTLIGGFGCIFAVIVLCLTGVYFNAHFRGKKPPKAIEDFMRSVIGAIVGLLIGFGGAPVGDAKTTTQQVSRPSTVPRSNRPAQAAPAPHPKEKPAPKAEPTPKN